VRGTERVEVKPGRVRDLAKLLGGILLAAALLLWVVRDTDLGAVWAQLRHAPVGLVLLALTLNLGHNVFRVWRWRLLLTPVRPGLPFRPLFTAIIVGYMTSWIIPGRLGEVVRPLLISVREKLPLGPCLGSVVADRMLDALAVVALFAVGSWITPLEGQAAEYQTLIRSGSVTLMAGVVLITGAMLVASSAGDRLEPWMARRSKIVRWAGRSLVAISSGVGALRSPRLILGLALQSALAWITIALATWCAVRAAGADVTLGAILVIQPLLVLGVAVPTPGGAGSYHGAMKLGLMLFGVAEVQAVTAGFLMHLVIVVPVIVLGSVLIWADRLSWRDLVASASQVRALGAERGTGSLVEDAP